LPKTSLNVFLAMLFSGLLAVGAAIVSDMLDNTVRDPEQVSRTLGTEVIGSLPQVKPWRGQIARVDLANPHQDRNLTRAGKERRHDSTYEEAIRTLRNAILLANIDQPPRTLLITSASPSEGKSTIAIHLAIAHAEQHKRTLLIDGDFRRPSVHKRFAVANLTGLSDVLVGESGWRDSLQLVPGLSSLEILPSGSASPRRAADLLGRNLLQVLEQASREYDLVVVDAPPLLGFPEPLQMAAAVDGVIIVAKAGETSRKGVATVMNTLRRIRANVLGLVLNEVHREISDSYYYYGYYGKYYKHYHKNRKS